MTLRDRVLPKIDRARSFIARIGLRRYAVTLRRRIWSGAFVDDGQVSNVDIVLVPTPRVRNKFSSKSISPATLEYILMNGVVISDRYYVIDKITPAYNFTENVEHEFASTPTTIKGGYLAEQLRMRPSPDVKNVEPVVILVGDDGYARECVQLTLEQDRAFGYTMLVKESDRPRTALTSMVISPSSPSIVHGTTTNIQVIGTFADGQMSQLQSLVVWTTSDPTVATIDVIGRLTGVAAGTCFITASLAGILISATVTVT